MTKVSRVRKWRLVQASRSAWGLAPPFWARLRGRRHVRLETTKLAAAAEEHGRSLDHALDVCDPAFCRKVHFEQTGKLLAKERERAPWPTRQSHAFLRFSTAERDRTT